MSVGSFFNYEQFMPHGMCYLWQPDILWTSVVSDVLIALAYYSVTVAFIVFVKRRADLLYPWFFILGGSVIFIACGTSHLIGAVVVWEPVYGVSAIVKAVTAISSLATGVIIWYVLPFFVSLPSPAMLEAKVTQRTEELKSSNDSLYKEIADHEQAREQLVQLRNYLRNIIDSMPSVLIGVDQDDRVTQWNNKAQQVTGMAAADALGQPLTHAFSRLSAEIERIHKAIKTRQKQADPKRPYQQDGTTRYEDITIYPLIANGVEGAVIRLDDITEQVRQEEMMIQSEKMLSVGGLAAGMAHEINNPLAGIMQTINVLKNRLSSTDMPANLRAAESAGLDMQAIAAYMEGRGILSLAENISESGQRVAEIVNNMLSFARKSDAVTSFESITELLDRTLELATCDYDLKKQYDFKTIDIVKQYAEKLPPVPCEGAKIQQVLLNILRNGAQAMQMAGIEKPSFTIRIRLESDRNMVCVEIEDNGPGMDEITQKRVFEPFFTTKPIGIGTGLGLSVSFFIITENHAGEMSVKSTPGSGATFTIRLPLAGPDSSHEYLAET